jgi:hypothetical protein
MPRGGGAHTDYSVPSLREIFRKARCGAEKRMISVRRSRRLPMIEAFGILA